MARLAGPRLPTAPVAPFCVAEGAYARSVRRWGSAWHADEECGLLSAGTGRERTLLGGPAVELIDQVNTRRNIGYLPDLQRRQVAV